MRSSSAACTTLKTESFHVNHVSHGLLLSIDVDVCVGSEESRGIAVSAWRDLVRLWLQKFSI